jgi:predicted metalloprotease with PDZ domain
MTPRPARWIAPVVAVIAAWVAPASVRSEAGVAYTFRFPEPEHHWMAVDAAFSGLPAGPLELRMSRSSPGRYSLHEFAKNVYDVEAEDAGGARVNVTRSDDSGWLIAAHPAAVTVHYKVFGDTLDGTYLAIDRSHAHINMPAAVMWARGLDDRPLTLTFVPPAGVRWQPATQLVPDSGRGTFSAPNLQYLMDSPVELGPLAVRSFTVDGQTIRFAVHHEGSDSDVDAFAADLQKVVSAERDVFGELATFEPGSYTFLADYLPYARADGMEHRNSTVLTSASAIRSNRSGLLVSAAHEFFHSWNVERIRPRSLEPFDFDRTNMSGELWLAEGFTQYYQTIAVSRAGLADLRVTVDNFSDLVRTVFREPGHRVRSAEEMSRMASFTDGGRPVDRTNWDNTFTSYYQIGGALALALDLSLRERSDGRVTLDDFMRAMWRVHGRPVPPRPGYVGQPYTSEDAEQRLADVSGDRAFASDFFKQYVRGPDTPDFAALLEPAGLVLRRQNPGRAWWGDVELQAGPRIARTPLSTTPAYKAGLDVGDEIRQIDEARTAVPDDIAAALRKHRPGDTIAVGFVDRTGAQRSTNVTLEEDPGLELIPVEAAGRTPSPAQRAFRDRWLGGKG